MFQFNNLIPVKLETNCINLYIVCWMQQKVVTGYAVKTAYAISVECTDLSMSFCCVF